jgi:hypothetical protein
MAISLIEKRTERASLVAQATRILDSCDAAGADAELSAQEEADFNKLAAQVAAIDAYIYAAMACRTTRRARLDAIAAEPDYNNPPPAPPNSPL